MSKQRLLHLDVLGRALRRNIFQVKARKVGLPPGSLIHVGVQRTERPTISLLDYDQDRCETRTDVSLEEAMSLKGTPTVSWINLSGIHDIGLVEKLGTHFGIHPLAMEDILNTQHRPKIEEFDGYCLVILKMLLFNDQDQTIDTEQVSLVIGPDYVISFQEREGDVFDAVRDRLQRGNGRIRQRGPDYLAYALLDSIVDSYFQILEKVGDRLLQLEEDLLLDPDQSTLSQVHHYKRELLLLRKSVWPLREVIAELHKGEVALISNDTRVFLRDLYDHSIQVLDTVEIFRDSISGLQDLYLSSVSNRMNEVMKVLTIMAALFIPLTFIVGVYGMNFEYMPELQWHWGYFAVWGVMICCVAGMLAFFRSKRWL